MLADHGKPAADNRGGDGRLRLDIVEWYRSRHNLRVAIGLSGKRPSTMVHRLALTSQPNHPNDQTSLGKTRFCPERISGAAQRRVNLGASEFLPVPFGEFGCEISERATPNDCRFVPIVSARAEPKSVIIA